MIRATEGSLHIFQWSPQELSVNEVKDSYLIDAAIWSLSNLHFEGMNRTGHQNFCSLPINFLEQNVKVLDF